MSLPPPDPKLLNRFPTVADLERLARRRMPHRLAGYVLAGADSGSGVKENRAAFERMRLVPRYAIKIGGRTTAVKLFGQTWSVPIGIAPIGLLGTLWPGAELAYARAARAAGVPFVLSTFAGESIETVGPVAGRFGWFQLYAYRDMATTRDMVRRAAAAGFGALVLTLDTPLYSKRPDDYRNGLTFPPKLTPAFLAEIAMAPFWALGALGRGYPAYGTLLPYVPIGLPRHRALQALLDAADIIDLSWDDVAIIRKDWSGPLIIKGLQHPGDALRAAELGADGVIVSNHGGRQLDAAPASLDTLPEIVEAAGDRIAVMLDSGIRSGLDIAKALVRGARFTFAARPFLYGVAAAGVRRGPDFVIRLLAEELSTALAQLGALTPEELRRAPGYEHRPGLQTSEPRHSPVDLPEQDHKT